MDTLPNNFESGVEILSSPNPKTLESLEVMALNIGSRMSQRFLKLRGLLVRLWKQQEEQHAEYLEFVDSKPVGTGFNGEHEVTAEHKENEETPDKQPQGQDFEDDEHEFTCNSSTEMKDEKKRRKIKRDLRNRAEQTHLNFWMPLLIVLTFVGFIHGASGSNDTPVVKKEIIGQTVTFPGTGIEPWQDTLWTWELITHDGSTLVLICESEFAAQAGTNHCPGFRCSIDGSLQIKSTAGCHSGNYRFTRFCGQGDSMNNCPTQFEYSLFIENNVNTSQQINETTERPKAQQSVAGSTGLPNDEHNSRVLIIIAAVFSLLALALIISVVVIILRRKKRNSVDDVDDGQSHEQMI